MDKLLIESLRPCKCPGSPPVHSGNVCMACACVRIAREPLIVEIPSIVARVHRQVQRESNKRTK